MIRKFMSNISISNVKNLSQINKKYYNEMKFLMSLFQFNMFYIKWRILIKLKKIIEQRSPMQNKGCTLEESLSYAVQENLHQCIKGLRRCPIMTIKKLMWWKKSSDILVNITCLCDDDYPHLVIVFQTKSYIIIIQRENHCNFSILVCIYD